MLSLLYNSNKALRRSTRERKATTIQIDGHTVLRKNNYTVRGLEYVWGAEPNEDPDFCPQEEARQTKAKKKTTRKKEVSPEERARVQHNEQVQASIHTKEPFWTSFLAKNIDILQPFCEPSDLELLKDDGIGYDETTVAVQPEAIQGTLREHQMEGLNFMVNMHRQNLSMILGDEMGLVRVSAYH